MRVSDMFQTRFLRASDVEDEPVTLTIAGVEPVELEDGLKYALCFEESDKQLVLNKTNARAVARLYGDDSDDWVGGRITLFAQQIDFKGEQVMAVRVSLRKPKLVDESEDAIPF